jgi:catechol 2,3-dioxygenase-like lactoylglutathione lyase family enzyme
MPITFQPPIPILRIFSVAKADEFYVDYLGFAVDWDHRFDNAAPLYRQISRAGLVLHLSEHHGDSCPGMCLRVATTDLAEFHAELAGKAYRYMRPGLEPGVVEGQREMEVIDPFGNRLCFVEEAKEEEPLRGLKT